RKEDRHDHPDRRRLAGAVRADEAAQRALGHDEVEILDRRRGAEALGQPFQMNRGVHGDRTGGTRRIGKRHHGSWARRVQGIRTLSKINLCSDLAPLCWPGAPPKRGAAPADVELYRTSTTSLTRRLRNQDGRRAWRS